MYISIHIVHILYYIFVTVLCIYLYLRSCNTSLDIYNIPNYIYTMNTSIPTIPRASSKRRHPPNALNTEQFLAAWNVLLDQQVVRLEFSSSPALAPSYVPAGIGLYGTFIKETAFPAMSACLLPT